ncbi:flippase (plasmid) [Lactobacillus plantarum] [Lactiplantibacillus mudanjiangensis]|uniref:oligosaccharide flippase family protein n=1 Tax=Lactiplantibacillus mudanjiangensis TaxID=1296538 RepID=UPI00101598E4|nr:flippase (plasmid) [Lactobacillus plantarum] [Lactiplantibacillus mudanjiangensis]
MKLVKNYLYNAWYQIFVIIVPLITTPYISRVLGSYGVGVNAYTSSIAQFFVIFAGLGINLYGNREIAYVQHGKEKLSQLFWEIELLRLIAVLIGCAIFGTYLLTNPKYEMALLLQGGLIISTGLDISWLFMGQEDFKRIVLKNAIVKIVSVILILIFVRHATDLNRYIFIISGSTLIGNLTLWSPLRHLVSPVPVSSLKIWRHLKPALLLLIPQIASQIYLVLNKTMLGQMAGITATGFFDNSDKIIKLILSLVTATGTVMLPRVAATFNQGNQKKVVAYLYNTFDFVTALSVPLFLGIAAIASGVAPFFLGSDFTGIDKIIMLESPVILIIAWSNVLGVQYLLPTKQNKCYTISVIIGAVVNISCNIPLISLMGTGGACVATVIAELSIMVFQLWCVRSEVQIRTLFNGNWKYWLSGLIMFGFIYSITTHVTVTIPILIGEILLGIVTYTLGLLVLHAPINTKVWQLLASKK